MAEPVKNKKVSLRDILEEMAEDEAFSNEEINKANNAALELEYERWSSRLKKSNP